MNPWFIQLQKVYEENYIKCKTNCVSIDEEKIKEFAIELAPYQIREPYWYGEMYPEDDHGFVQFLGISTAINACYNAPGSTKKFNEYWHGRLWIGADALSACFMKAIEGGVPILDAKFLANLKLEFLYEYFPSLPLPERRWDALVTVGETLLQKYDGHFINLIKKADHKCFNNGNGICELLARDFTRAYSDVRNTKKIGFTPFYKKALLFALMYEGRAKNSKLLKELKDPESISPIVDYQIPKILHYKGILKYTKDLEDVIKQRKEIPEFSETEAAIRLTTAIAWKKLLDEINKIKMRKFFPPVTMMGLDYLLWLAGRQLKDKEHHRTLTITY